MYIYLLVCVSVSEILSETRISSPDCLALQISKKKISVDLSSLKKKNKINIDQENINSHGNQFRQQGQHTFSGSIMPHL